MKGSSKSIHLLPFLAALALSAQAPSSNSSSPVERGSLPARIHFTGVPRGATADPLSCRVAQGLELLLDDVLLFEPGAGEKVERPFWVERMRQVHERFTGTQGTLAHFGDSITVTLAYWAPLAAAPKNMDASTALAYQRVKAHLKPEMWRGWKGPQFGSEGRMTVRWALENVDRWLETMKPEAATLMFGSNDVDQMEVEEYEATIRELVRRCLARGTVVLLSTPPPRRARLEKCRRFADAIRRVAREERVPLIDFFAEILRRRPQDWDGSLPQFKDARGNEYQVPTLMARDGVHPSNPSAWMNDFSEEGLRRNGYTLRNYLVLRAYAELLEQVGLGPP